MKLERKVKRLEKKVTALKEENYLLLQSLLQAVEILGAAQYAVNNEPQLRVITQSYHQLKRRLQDAQQV